MRCADVTRELIAPSAGVDASAVARHVASCPECAAREEEARRFDRLWDATRPEEPPVTVWDQLWARVGAGIEAAPAVLHLPAAPAPRRWLVPALTTALIAQSAAALIVIGVLLNHHPAAPSVVVQPISTAPRQSVVFELNTGQTLFLELDESGGRVVCKPQTLDTAELAAFDGEDGPDVYAVASQADMIVLNAMEGME